MKTVLCSFIPRGLEKTINKNSQNERGKRNASKNGERVY